jgi:catecholate siderophore receptor
VGARTISRPVTFIANGANTDAEADIAAAYIQDQIRLTENLEIVIGARFDRFSLDVTNLNNGAEFSRTDELFSPRLGIILKPIPTLSFYASYGRSYLPSAGDQFASLDLTSEALKPEKFDNYEIGAKWEPLPGLLATLAAYQLDRTNTRAPGATPGTVVLTGEQRSRGIEATLERNITNRWQVSAGYAYQKAEIRRTTSAAPAGREVPLVPRHQFSFWNRYDFNRTLGVGLGVIAASKSFASISNAVTLPAMRASTAPSSTASRRAWRRRSMSRTCSAKITSRPRTTTTTLPLAHPPPRGRRCVVPSDVRHPGDWGDEIRSSR